MSKNDQRREKRKDATERNSEEQTERVRRVTTSRRHHKSPPLLLPYILVHFMRWCSNLQPATSCLYFYVVGLCSIMLFIERDTRPTSALLPSAAQSLILPWVYSSSPAGADDGPALRAPGPGADLCVRPQRGLSVLGKPRLQRPERQGEDAGKRSPPSPSVVGDFFKEKNNTSTDGQLVCRSMSVRKVL